MNETPTLWLPTEELVARANVSAYMRWLERQESLEFSDYERLWRWSVDYLEDFWEAVWRYYVPDEIVVAPAIPRTLTGKKLEVPVKRILEGPPPDRAASLGSVDEPAALDWYAEFASRWRTAGGPLGCGEEPPR
jgi:hypothetical protein